MLDIYPIHGLYVGLAIINNSVILFVFDIQVSSARETEKSYFRHAVSPLAICGTKIKVSAYNLMEENIVLLELGRNSDI